jgi:hypothetical protein
LRDMCEWLPTLPVQEGLKAICMQQKQ